MAWPYVHRLMIEINLLPKESRAQKKATNFSPELLLYLAPVILGLLLLAHIYFFALVFIKNQQLNSLDKKWASLEPDRKLLESLNKEYNVTSQDELLIDGVSLDRFNWAEKLNKLSLDLPSGVWFTQISFANDNFTLNGSVFSFQKEEINLINKFLDSLKNDPGFMRNFISLELGPIQRKTITSYDVVDFILSGKLKGQ